MSSSTCDWTESTLADVVKPDKPIVYGIVQAGPECPGGVPYIKSKDVRGRIDPETLSHTTREIADRYRRSVVRPGDIVFSLRGNIGELSVVPPDLLEANLTQGTARISVDGKVSNEYIAFALREPSVQRRIARLGKGSTFQEISLRALRKLVIPLPPLPEQRKIAEILRTWDEAIEKLEALLVAKRGHVAGITQRLIGHGSAFPPKWQLKPLASIAAPIRRRNDGGDHPVMTISAKSGFLMQADKFARDMAGRSVERYTLLCEGEFAYNKGNSLTAPYGCVYRLNRTKALVPFVYFCFELDSGLDHCFYDHLFSAGVLNHQLSRLINSGVRNDGLLNVNATDFFGCRVPVPPLDEQRDIARTLSVVKMELSLLENQVDALTRQKRGLMQKLLTGEWQVDVRGT